MIRKKNNWGTASPRNSLESGGQNCLKAEDRAKNRIGEVEQKRTNRGSKARE